MKRFLLGLIMAAGCATMGMAQTKSVSILGDSYSTFEGYMTPETNELWYYDEGERGRTDVTDVTETWWHQLIARQGWRLCVNNSYSGATISYTGYSGNDYSKRSFLTRMTNLGCPDVIFIFGATNDSWANAPIGEYQYENLTKSNLWTFRPAMAKMLEWMTKRYVGTEIYFLLNDGLKAEINESVKTICSHYGVKCIELTGIDKMSGHPSVKGMKQIADQVAQALR